MDQKQTNTEQKTKDDWNEKNRPPQADQPPAREPLAPPEADDEDEDVEDDDRFQATDN
jgi:hypothetical protein